MYVWNRNIFRFSRSPTDMDKFIDNRPFCGTLRFPGNHSLVGYIEIHSLAYFSALQEGLYILQAFLPKKNKSPVIISSTRRGVACYLTGPSHESTRRWPKINDLTCQSTQLIVPDGSTTKTSYHRQGLINLQIIHAMNSLLFLRMKSFLSFWTWSLSGYSTLTLVSVDRVVACRQTAPSHKSRRRWPEFDNHSYQFTR